MWKHLKTGGYYQIIDEGKMQCADRNMDMTDVIIYQDMLDYNTWVRPKDEFYDGRFERVDTTASIPILHK